MAQMTALRRRMIDDMTVRNLSPATQQSYVYLVEPLHIAMLYRMDVVAVGAIIASISPCVAVSVFMAPPEARG